MTDLELARAWREALDSVRKSRGVPCAGCKGRRGSIRAVVFADRTCLTCTIKNTGLRKRDVQLDDIAAIKEKRGLAGGPPKDPTVFENYLRELHGRQCDEMLVELRVAHKKRRRKNVPS